MKIPKKLLILLIIVLIVSTTSIIAYAAFRYEVSGEKTMDMPTDLKDALLEYHNQN